jgi:hypothetical protein
LLSPERLLTLRSRGIGIVAGVQTLSSLELAYGATSRTLVENFNNKIVLPGGPVSDADAFSRASGEQLVVLPRYEAIANRPLLSSAEIRTPHYSHNLLGHPATLMLGPWTFQAYLQRSYELPAMASLLHDARRITGHERLRGQKLSKTRPATQVNRSTETAVCESSGWSEERILNELEALKKQLGWDTTSGTARDWWDAFERLNAEHIGTVLELAKQLVARSATISEFVITSLDSKTHNIAAQLHYLDYQRAKKRAEARKQQSANSGGR